MDKVVVEVGGEIYICENIEVLVWVEEIVEEHLVVTVKNYHIRGIRD